MFRFEHRRQPLLPLHAFMRRLGRFAAAGLAVVAGGLAIGIVGYHVLVGLSWLDSFLNAAMILGGMGPVNLEFHSDAGKLFAGLYALFSGFVVLLVAGLVFTPLLHRLLHRFHLEAESPDEHRDRGARGHRRSTDAASRPSSRGRKRH